jgi:hypothetical protein
VFSFCNLNTDTAIANVFGSRLYVYVRNSKGPSLKPCGNPCLAGSQFRKVYMYIVYWTVHLKNELYFGCNIYADSLSLMLWGGVFVVLVTFVLAMREVKFTFME